MAATAPLAVFTFANPALLWGAAACVIPLAIHLFMRARPRRQSFPAMQLLLATKTASVREHRLRNLLLLLLRMLAIALLVAAMARPISRGSWLATRSRGATAAAFVIDDSASMSQRFAGQTRLERGRAWATRLLNDATRFPIGSSFAILSSGYAAGPARLVDAQGEALRMLLAMPDDAHDRSLGAAIDRGAALVGTTKTVRRELYIITDNTQAAWADATAGRWAGLSDTAIFILDVGDTEKDNVRLVNLRIPSPVVPPRTPIKVQCTLQPADRTVHTLVDAYVDGTVVARSEPLSTVPGQPQDVAITLPRLSPGVHACELRLAGPDSNSIDDSLFFALEARPPPGVFVVSTTNDPADLDEAQRVAALLSPPTLPEDRRPFQVQVRSPLSGGEDIYRTGDAGSVIWIGEPNLTAVQRQAYDAFLRSGGRLLVLPSTSVKPGASRSELLPARWNRIVTLDHPTTLHWSSNAGAAAVGATSRPATRLPFDLAFTRREDVDPLSTRQVVRYAALTADSNAMRLAEFEGGQPAILARSVGSGVVVQFAFRLDPQWGDLGVRAATAMVMFHGMVGVSSGASSRVAQLHCGETAELDCAGAPEAVVTVTAGRGKRDPLAPEKRRLGPTGRLSTSAISAGVYPIRGTGTDNAVAAYAVNLREGETLAERTPPEQIRAAFAPGAAVILSDPATLETPSLTVAGDREWDGYLFLALIALLAGEIFFANRFYRTR